MYRVVHQRLALSSLRLGLAAVAFAGSIAAGAGFAAAGVGLALGAAICGLALVTDRRWLLLGTPSAEPLPDDVRRAPLARAVAEGMLPSTAGVAVLAVASIQAYRMSLKPHERKSDQPLLNRRVAQMVGRTFVLEQPIANGTGKVRLNDALWTVQGPDAPVGARVVVVGAEGQTLQVRVEA